MIITVCEGCGEQVYRMADDQPWRHLRHSTTTPATPITVPDRVRYPD